MARKKVEDTQNALMGARQELPADERKSSIAMRTGSLAEEHVKPAITLSESLAGEHVKPAKTLSGRLADEHKSPIVMRQRETGG